MSLVSVVALLQAALMLLSLAQSTPSIPQSFRDQATQVAQQAIATAVSTLAAQQTETGSQTPSTPAPNSTDRFTTPSGAIVDAYGNVITSAQPTINVSNGSAPTGNQETFTISVSPISTNPTTASIHIEWDTSIPTESKIFLTPLGGTTQVVQSKSGNSTHHIVDFDSPLSLTPYTYTIEAISSPPRG